MCGHCVPAHQGDDGCICRFERRASFRGGASVCRARKRVSEGAERPRETAGGGVLGSGNKPGGVVVIVRGQGRLCLPRNVGNGKCSAGDTHESEAEARAGGLSTQPGIRGVVHQSVCSSPSAPGARWTGSGLPLPLALRRPYRYRYRCGCGWMVARGVPWVVGLARVRARDRFGRG